MISHRIRAVLCTLLVTMSGATGLAAEKVSIRTNLPAGTGWSFVSNEQMDMNSSMKANGQQQQMQQKVSRKISGRADVLEANSGVPTVLRVSFDRDSGGEMDAGQMGKQPMPFGLAGRTVTVKIGPNGAITHDAGQLAPPDEQELTALAEADQAYLPKEPVGVGDTWSPDLGAVARKWQVDPAKSKLGLSLTLKDWKDVDGRRAAVVEFAGEVAGDMEGMSGSRHMRGIAMIDVQSGRVVNVDMTGKMQMSGIQQQQGQDDNIYVMEIQSEGTMAQRASAKFGAGSGTGTGVGGGAAAPGGFGGFTPITPPPGGTAKGGNGAGGMTPGANTSGANTPAVVPPNTPPNTPSPAGKLIFKDETITLAFNRNALTPGTTGTITMGDKQFPVKVSAWDGSTLAGTFDADGASFDFTGKLNGDTLVFKTGESTYNLQNAAPAKKNPLAK